MLFELIALMGLAGIITCCVINLVEMSRYDSEEEYELKQSQALSKSASSHKNAA